MDETCALNATLPIVPSLVGRRAAVRRAVKAAFEPSVEPVEPSVLYLYFFASCLFLLGVYAACRLRFTSPKERCWILTAVNSAVTPALSIRSLFRVVNNRWEYGVVGGCSRSSRFATVFFAAYLVCELFVSSVEYRRYVSLVMGYVHHVTYLFLCYHLLSNNRTNVLAMSLLEELPTLILACSRLGRFGHRTRAAANASDFAFGVSFVVTRVVFHLYVQHHMFQLRHDPDMGHYWVIMMASFGLNVYWLLAWWRSVRRRRGWTKAARAAKAGGAKGGKVSSAGGGAGGAHHRKGHFAQQCVRASRQAGVRFARNRARKVRQSLSNCRRRLKQIGPNMRHNYELNAAKVRDFATKRLEDISRAKHTLGQRGSDLGRRFWMTQEDNPAWEIRW